MNTNPVSWDELEKTTQWRALTPSQRGYCRALVTNGGDPRAATLTAYKCSSQKNAVCLSYEVRKHPSVTAFLELYDILTFGPPSKEQQIASVLKTIHESPAYSRVRAQRLLAELTGFVGASPDEQDSPDHNLVEVDVRGPISRIGDVVLQEGQKYRVTAVNKHGVATDGDLIETV